MNKKIISGLSLFLMCCMIDINAKRALFKGPATQAEIEHKRIVAQFDRLERSLGIPQQRLSPKGPQKTKDQRVYNGIRIQLYNLLSKPGPLSDKDANDILDKIKEFDDLNPHRWPGPRDYQLVFDARVRGAMPAAMAPMMVPPMHRAPSAAAQERERLKMEFAELQQLILGPAAATPAQMSEYRKVKQPKGLKQADYNKIRGRLNDLLKQDLTEEKITEIQKNIDELKRINPSYWPRAEDYQAILDIRKS